MKKTESQDATDGGKLLTKRILWSLGWTSWYWPCPLPDVADVDIDDWPPWLMSLTFCWSWRTWSISIWTSGFDEVDPDDELGWEVTAGRGTGRGGVQPPAPDHDPEEADVGLTPVWGWLDQAWPDKIWRQWLHDVLWISNELLTIMLTHVAAT